MSLEEVVSRVYAWWHCREMAVLEVRFVVCWVFVLVGREELVVVRRSDLDRKYVERGGQDLWSDTVGG